MASTLILHHIGRCQALIPLELWTKCSEASGNIASPDSKQQIFTETKYFKSHFEKLKGCFNILSKRIKLAF